MSSGYVLDFSNRTFAEFFAAEMDVDIEADTWSGNGTSKANRLRAYLQIASDGRAARVLRLLHEYRMNTSSQTLDVTADDQRRFVEILQRLQASGDLAHTDAVDRFMADRTLDELIDAIERDVQADKPQVALDRLHTYCIKKFAHLVTQYRPGISPSDTLNARAGQYFNELKREAKQCRPISFEIMGTTIRIFELFNDVRNNHSLAHDNTLVDKAEARFAFEAVCNLLRFAKATEGQRFGA